MIDHQTTPSVTEMAEFEAGMRLWSMQQAISEYCYRERSRSRMHAVLNAELKPHGFMVLDLCNWGPRR